jgi:glutaryl-CoA dehydrogenase (non-decarboxylating)
MKDHAGDQEAGAMLYTLTPSQREAFLSFRRFVDEEIAPYADEYDREERVPPALMRKLAQQGYLGALAPQNYGGLELDWIGYGLLNEAVGRGCSSVRSLLTVQSMVIAALLRWGSPEQKERWLPQLTRGELFAAFGLTEPDAGSDARAIQTKAIPDGGIYRVSGRKKWITGGQVADLFLIFAQSPGGPLALLIERACPGLSLVPITGLLGTRASLLAELHLHECPVPRENVVGRSGFGFSHVLSSALHVGRYSVAWGCVGLVQACLEKALDYASERSQFGKPLKEHQLVRQLLTEMFTRARAAELFCFQAGLLAESGDPRALGETALAKYVAARAAMQVANDAVQIYGANGCGSEYPIQRYWRDARIMEIIEGSTQIQQVMLADYAYQVYRSEQTLDKKEKEERS